MNNVKSAPAGQNNTFKRILPGLLISAAALAAMYFFVDLEALRSALLLADYRWLPVVILALLGTLMARAKSWRTLLDESASLKECFVVLNQAYLLNNVLPFRLGELGRALLLGRSSQMGFWRVISTVIVERVLDLAIVAGLLLFSLPLVVGAEWARSAAVFAIGVVGLGFIVLFLIARNPQITLRVLENVTRPWPRLQGWLKDKVSSFLEGLAVLKDGNRFVRVLVWMLLTWFFNVACYYTLMLSFLPQAPWLWAIFSLTVVSLGVAVPSSPSSVGVLEAAMVGALSLFGVDPPVSFAYALTMHIIYFVVTGLIGAYGFWQQGQSLGAIYRRLLARPASDE